MAQPIVIENDALRMEVWPQWGGKISSLIDKADRFELLFNYPTELPDGYNGYGLPYVNGWYAGWDECFPSVTSCRYPLHPYEHIEAPDHGELWSLPTTAVPTRNGITTVWHGLRFGYRIARKLTLDGPQLTAEYTLVNLAPFEFRFVWAPHALLALDGPVELKFPGQPGASWTQAGPHPGTLSLGQAPANLGSIDLTRPFTAAPGKVWTLHSTQHITEPAQVNYPERGRSLSVEFASESNLLAHWTLWINTGGWARHQHLAVMPTIGASDDLSVAISDDLAGRIEPMGKTSWMTRWRVG